MKTIARLFITLTACAVSFGANAACMGVDTIEFGYSLTALPEFDVADSALPDGSVLFSTRLLGGSGTNLSGDCGERPVQIGYTQPMGSYNTVSSGVSGIGIRIRWAGGHRGLPDGYLPLTTSQTVGARNNFRWDWGTKTIEFVKTGPLRTGSFQLPSRRILQMSVPSRGVSGIAYVLLYGPGTKRSPTIVIKSRPTCSVSANSRSINVPMGKLPDSTFSGVGSWSNEEPFNIVLECSAGDAGTSRGLSITFTDPSNAGNQSDILPLSSISTARGIAVQLLTERGAVIKYGPDSALAGAVNQWRAGTVIGGASGTQTFTIPLKARYIQTALGSTAGSADAAATFTMSYD